MIAIASDHAGYCLKQVLLEHLSDYQEPILDLGTSDTTPVDYPDIAHTMARALLDGHIQQGILICGTGIGMSIAANRYSDIRAAVCHDTTSAFLARSHNDANILTLGARLIGSEVAWDCVKIFLNTPFSSKHHHAKRIAKLSSLRTTAKSGPLVT